ncbi:argininosuccinate lyase [Melioribacteraceae bacterium 4301-Me]|uniref:argininosuccinate lyase n=1 Tax=Pyranulibacter aquaticus TaxID=3163344 RepID=UPI003594AF9A
MLWGGRFKKELDKLALKFSSSLNIDINLFEEDILVNLVHSEMLSNVGLITNEDFKKIKNGLNLILEEYRNGKWKPESEKFEDVHSAIESRLSELIGETAGKLHTGRSRNDQIATDERLWIKKVSSFLENNISNFQKTLIKVADVNINTIMPGYTHLQRAQPVSFAFHLLAYVEMLQRDKKRFNFVKNETNESPLGAGALAGSTLPLDRNYTTKKLGFAEPTRNALDSVSDRDFLLDFLNAVSIGMMHLSRLAEELILWSSSEWNFVQLPEEFTTGSSLMPQKKNPDMAELIRGKAGRTFGNYISLITTIKGLPLSYNRDLQEDKEHVFDSFFTYADSLTIMNKMFEKIEVNTNRFKEELKNSFILSTDLADWLVLNGIAFREAHRIVGELVKFCEENRISFSDLNLEQLKKINQIFTGDALKCLDVETSLQRKQTFGSPNPKLVKEQIEFWKDKLHESV